MRYFISIVVFLGYAFQVLCQAHSWSDTVAKIIYDNCSSCHHDGGIAPFSLMSYDQTKLYGEAIHHAIEERSMPPWPADPNYRHFIGEEILEQSEVDAIHAWIEDDYPMGIEGGGPEPPQFEQSESSLEKIDFTVAIDPYTLQSNFDEYRWFAIENPFDEVIFINKVEVIAGLEEVVHHADLFYDSSNQTADFDALDPLPGFNNSTGAPSSSHYINAWAPGGEIAYYPDNWGHMIPAGGYFAIEIHYGPGGIGQVDSTLMNLQFVKETESARQMKAGWLLHDSAPMLIDGPLFIPADSVVTFHQESDPLPDDISIISICPHMHFLGKSYRVWYETLEGDSIPLIDIPHWDFHWQKYYTYPSIEVIPRGAVLKSEGVYDNTLNNHDNPNNPPIDVSRGLKTTDEMFLCYFMFTDYQDGDEFVSLEEANEVSGQKDEHISQPILTIYPNPCQDQIKLECSASFTEVKIIDAVGNFYEINAQTTRNVSMLDISHLPKGIYLMQINASNTTLTTKFIKP